MNDLSRRNMLKAASGALGGGLLTPRQLAEAALPGENRELRRPEHRLKVVVTGGHPGDPEYGCGGTVARYSDMGHEVVLLYLNTGNPGATEPKKSDDPRVSEARKACDILKARPLYAAQIDGHAIVDETRYDQFRQLLEGEKPDVVFTHWPIDNHRDHRAISLLTYDAWLKLKKSFALYYYEVSTGEDTLQFSPTDYVDITETETRKRLACFAHASQSPDKYYSLQEQVGKFRGLERGCRQAEAFIRHVQSREFRLPQV